MKTKDIIPVLHDFVNSTDHMRSYDSIRQVSKKKDKHADTIVRVFETYYVDLKVTTNNEDTEIINIDVIEPNRYFNLLYHYCSIGDNRAFEILDRAKVSFPLNADILVANAFATAIMSGKFSFAIKFADKNEELNNIEKIYNNGVPHILLVNSYKFGRERLFQIFTFFKNILNFNADIMLKTKLNTPDISLRQAVSINGYLGINEVEKIKQAYLAVYGENL